MHGHSYEKGRVSSAIADKIRDAIPIYDFISRYVALRQRASDEFVGLCPFHQEKTPSFTVNTTKRFYHCFGCGAHGDAISFMMGISGLSYGIVVEQLAKEYGVPFSRSSAFKQDQKQIICYEIYEQLCAFYTEELKKNGEPEEARRYLAGRGITKETLEAYRLGYAPSDTTRLASFLKERFSVDDIIFSKALISTQSNRGQLFNPFRGRVIFPIQDSRGQVVAFGGRIIDRNDGVQNFAAAKYLNSSENLIFHKGNILYGLNRVDIRDMAEHPIILVEGYMDVIALANAGVKNSVASLGTGVTMEQVKLMWRITNTPIVYLDNDVAGQKAMLRLATEALRYITADKSLNFMTIDGAKDADEVINKYGVRFFSDAITHSTQGLADFLFTARTIGRGFDTPEAKVKLMATLDALVNLIQDKRLRSEYKAHFFKLYRAAFHTFQVGKKKSTMRIEDSSKGTSMLTGAKVILYGPLFTILAIVSADISVLDDENIKHDFAALVLEEKPLIKLHTFLLQSHDARLCCDDTMHSDIEKDAIAEIVGRDLAVELDRALESVRNEAPIALVRAFKLNYLHTIKYEIATLEKEICNTTGTSINNDVKFIERLRELKKHELAISTELNVI